MSKEKATEKKEGKEGEALPHLVWIDLEMTGLDPEKERIIEIATLVTDSDLNLLAEGPVLAIHQPDALLEAMDAWCTRTHAASGLTARVRASEWTTAAAEAATLAFLRQYAEPGTAPLCGNSVHQDRRFMQREMPELEAFFHYRHLDVSTLKELAKRWNPQVKASFKKQNVHLALDDIYESLAELRHYREHFLRTASPEKDGAS